MGGLRLYDRPEKRSNSGMTSTRADETTCRRSSCFISRCKDMHGWSIFSVPFSQDGSRTSPRRVHTDNRSPQRNRAGLQTAGGAPGEHMDTRRNFTGGGPGLDTNRTTVPPPPPHSPPNSFSSSIKKYKRRRKIRNVFREDVNFTGSRITVIFDQTLTGPPPLTPLLD